MPDAPALPDATDPVVPTGLADPPAVPPPDPAAPLEDVPADATAPPEERPPPERGITSTIRFEVGSTTTISSRTTA
jgi:hypothetical protein